MPRPGLPPTPASSTEIRGKDQAEAIDEFSLPPAALHTSSAPNKVTSSLEGDVTTSPTGAKRKRRDPSMSVDARPAAQVVSADSTFSLPPPPSRSRKIIQVQPEDAKGASSKTSSAYGRKKGDTGRGTAATSKTTAASRKTARKTAHSIIERRRRSKMNDEFETLKELVPAARGQNMHKLAILQAGIEYVRYLEDCIEGLKGAQSGQSSAKSTPFHAPVDSRPISSESHDADDMEDDNDYDEDDDDMDQDEANEAQAATTPRPSRPASAQHSNSDASNTPSPAIYPLNAIHSRKASSSYAISTGSPSPAILPSFYPAYVSTTATSSALPSPALLPTDSKTHYPAQTSGQVTPITSSNEYHALQAHAKKALAYHGEADQEVIATLAMMGTERRRSQEEKDRADGTRGMSVRDLLSG